MKAFPEVQALVDALDEPTLLVSGGRVIAANSAATELLGRATQGADVRLAIRHPAALECILSGERKDIDITGIGSPDRPWRLLVRPVGRDAVLARLIDQAAAQSAEKMRVDFVANASHELRTPLTTILGYAETLAEEGDLDPQLQLKFGSTIRSEAQRMLRIIEDLMSLSRIEADRFVTPRDEVSLAEIAELSAAHGRDLADRRDCMVELNVETDLPQVRADFGQLLQMADNLVSNAIRYGCGTRGCTVRIEARRADGAVLLSVSDDGEGIAPEHLPRITQRFYRVDDARSRDSGGTGLGLAIVKHIVERHRGTLDIKSIPGRGTQVVVRLPAS